MIRSPIKRANDRFYTKDGSTSQFDDFFNQSIWFNGAEIIIDEGLRNIETDDTIEKKEVPHIERYLCETLFSSVVDNFQCYLSEILLHIFDERPELLSSGSTKNSLIFSHDDILSLKRSIVEQTVLGLGYKRIDELDRYFLENFKFSLTDSKLENLRLNRLVQIRNIIAHNRGLVNAQFLKKAGAKADVLGEKVILPNLYAADIYLIRLAERIDHKAMAHFKIGSLKEN